MLEEKKFKTGDTVEETGVYVDEWQIVKQLKKGSKFPKDPNMGETIWQKAKYPYSNQITSKNVPEEYRK